MEYQDILYETRDGIAWITINRPKKLNAFRPHTVNELIDAFRTAWYDREVGVVILTGAGDRAFCVGGDVSDRDLGGYQSEQYDGPTGMRIEELHEWIRNCPKPVIAAVNGYAIGGGHVLHVLCDLTIAADTAKLGQVGPKVGSVDPGYGTAYLARIVGQKKAKEIWFMCRQYTAQEAADMGLVNKVVPKDQLLAEAEAWAKELLLKSPMAIRIAKASLNADTANINGISQLGFRALELYYDTEEAAEGARAFNEKRAPEFGKYRK